jgi:predicted neuraminidase
MDTLQVNVQPGPEYGADERKYQGIPGIERAPGGRLWAVFYAGKVHEDRYNYVCCVTSGDDGKTWSDLKFVIDPDGDGPLRTSDPCPWLDPDGRLWLFFWMNGGGDTQLFAMHTDNPDDENATWTTPHAICPGVMMCKPIVATDGTWLLPTAIWHRDQSCRVVASTDKGKTWELRGTAGVPDPKDRNCDEPMMVQRHDGSLWLLVRTSYGIGESVSRDMGRTWTPVKPSGIPHPASRFFIRRLVSGNLLLVKHGPMDKKTGRSHLTAFVSRNDGASWEGGLLLDERGGVSYPDGTQSADGLVRIIYDWNRADEKHILMTTFTEEDVLAGKDVSGRMRQRVLVNHATGVNPKPWRKDGRFLRLKKNDDGVPLVAGPRAEVELDEGELREATVGKAIFSNRSYVFHEMLPETLRGRPFVFSTMEKSAIRVTKPGVVHVLTPLPARNHDTQAEALAKQGFAKVAVREFVLFPNANGDVSSANAVSVFQKETKAGETLELGKWAVILP